LSIGSDDPSVFNCTLTSDLILVSTEMGVKVSAICSSMLEAVDFSFTNKEEKEKIRDKLRFAFDQFLE
jgi:adenosine deaminase